DHPNVLGQDRLDRVSVVTRHYEDLVQRRVTERAHGVQHERRAVQLGELLRSCEPAALAGGEHDADDHVLEDFDRSASAEPPPKRRRKKLTTAAQSAERPSRIPPTGLAAASTVGFAPPVGSPPAVTASPGASA